jgi:hypothetical protein
VWKRAPRRTATAVLGLSLLIGVLGAFFRGGDEMQTAAPDRCRPAANVKGKRPSGQTVVVPPVQGMDVDDAFARLAEAGLRPTTTRPARIAYHISSLSVIEQEPAAGARVPREAAVALGLDQGHRGLLPGVEDRIVVPHLVGLNLEAAIHVLNARDEPPLFWQVELPPLPPTDAQAFTAAYCVTGQEPSAGATVVQAKDGAVSIGVRLSAAPAGG